MVLDKLEPKIDFIILGSQKAGTTALFNFMLEDEDIVLPDDKESPFFCKNQISENDFERYLKYTYGSFRADGKYYGKITPQYLYRYTPSADNIKHYLGDVAMFAILRDPIARFKSHYKMLYTRGEVKVGINEYVASLVNDFGSSTYSFDISMKNEAENTLYIGLYGQQVHYYRSIFSGGSINLYDYDELICSPEIIYKDIISKIKKCKVEDVFIPKNIDKKYFDDTRVQSSKFRLLLKKVGLKSVFNILPPKIRALIRKKFDLLLSEFYRNTATKNIDTTLSEASIHLLRSFYKSDVETLSSYVYFAWMKEYLD